MKSETAYGLDFLQQIIINSIRTAILNKYQYDATINKNWYFSFAFLKLSTGPSQPVTETEHFFTVFYVLVVYD